MKLKTLLWTGMKVLEIMMIKDMKRKKCVACGNSIIEKDISVVCRSCKSENIESKLLNNWQL